MKAIASDSNDSKRAEVKLNMILNRSIMKTTKHCLKKGGVWKGEWEYNGGDELYVQNTLYARLELSQ
jgi:hypothetical protein